MVKIWGPSLQKNKNKKWCNNPEGLEDTPFRFEHWFDKSDSFPGSYENGATGGQGGAASRRGKKRTLEELYKPPIDIIFKGDFQTARESATSAKKWLLVNIQDAGEFQCQVLNRDVWSNEAVKTILREHFIFWQVSKKVFVFL